MIRVVIADDETLVRSGVRMILEASDDLSVVAEAEDGAGALAAVQRHHPDVLLLDVRMPGMDGLTAAGELRHRTEAPAVIMLTTYDLDEYVHQALRTGACGFLLKDTRPRDLAAAVRTAAAGEAMLAPSVTRRLIDTFAERDPSRVACARDRLTGLTGRERQVAYAVARGLSNVDIGRELAMNEAAVKAHVSRTLTKLGLANRVQLALLVRDAGPP